MKLSTSQGRVIVTAVAMEALVVGCGGGPSDSSTSDRCLSDMLDETVVVERQYRAGQLSGVEKTFLDEHGESVAAIVAEARIRGRDPECDELWGPMDETP